MKKFTPCLSIPEAGSPWFNNSKKGGYSTAITGKPTCEGLNVLSNCVGWSFGRFCQLAGDTSMSLLSPVNAKDFIKYKDKSLKVGTDPKLGACMVWDGGASKCGHVAIVEEIHSDGSITTSESGYGCLPAFYTKRRTNDGNWGQPINYSFLGFIYQPEDFEMDNSSNITFAVEPVQKGSTGATVKQVQSILKGLGYYTGNIDGEAGELTAAAIKKFQQSRKLYVDGIFYIKCWQSWLGG